MKLVLRTQASLLAILVASPLACSSRNELPLDDLCAQMALDRYEYLPVGTNVIGSFESVDSTGTSLSGIDAGALLADDDDLTDDYPIFLEGKKLYEDVVAPKYAAEIAIYEAMDPEKAEDAFTAEESAAVERLRNEMAPELVAVCKNYVLPVAGSSVAPTFLHCKDKWDQNGDGVVALYPLDTAAPGSQDAALGACTTVTGGENAHAINAWGPLSKFATDVDQEVPYDGFTYSGITVPLTIATYQHTADASEWEGVAFWARLATASEAVPLDSPNVFHKDDLIDAGAAEPRDGVGQLGVIIQTIDTAAFSDGLDALKFRADSTNCYQLDEAGNVVVTSEPGMNGVPITTPVTGPCFPTPQDFADFEAPELTDATGVFKYGLLDAQGQATAIPQPFCADYSPVDAVVGEETPFRNQCWDGFRSMMEISQEWEFYFLPFDEMRQAGWGQVAPSFRVDQIRSVNFLTSAFQSVNVLFDEVSYYRRRPTP